MTTGFRLFLLLKEKAPNNYASSIVEQIKKLTFQDLERFMKNLPHNQAQQ